MKWVQSLRPAEIGRAILYAVVTALMILGLAVVLGRENAIARDQAYFEIHDHRVAAACANAEIVDALNRLLVSAGEEPMPELDVSELECGNLRELLPTNEEERP